MKNKRWASVKETFNIAFAYVGIITGAGLATGKELVQYFVSFGLMGIFGIVAIAMLFMLFGSWILSLGSFYQSESHMEVFENLRFSWIAKSLDYSLIFACFVMSFVMIAGAGSSLSQQFGGPTWIGSAICSLMILAVCYMDFDKVMTALGIFTPFILVMLLIGLISIAFGPEIDWQAQFNHAAQIPTTLPNVGVSVINYLAMNLMLGTSMMLVLGGSVKKIGHAEKGGMLGGFLFGAVALITVILIYAKIDVIGDSPVPMLMFMTEIHPLIGLIMFIIIFGMIFNTGFSVCYSLGKRITGDNERLFKQIMPVIVGVSFLLSLFGFSDLIAVMYPLLGYIGIVLLITIAGAWYMNRHNIAYEKKKRV